MQYFIQKNCYPSHLSSSKIIAQTDNFALLVYWSKYFCLRLHGVISCKGDAEYFGLGHTSLPLQGGAYEMEAN